MPLQLQGLIGLGIQNRHAAGDEGKFFFKKNLPKSHSYETLLLEVLQLLHHLSANLLPGRVRVSRNDSKRMPRRKRHEITKVGLRGRGGNRLLLVLFFFPRPPRNAIRPEYRQTPVAMHLSLGNYIKIYSGGGRNPPNTNATRLNVVFLRSTLLGAGLFMYREFAGLAHLRGALSRLSMMCVYTGLGSSFPPFYTIRLGGGQA